MKNLHKVAFGLLVFFGMIYFAAAFAGEPVHAVRTKHSSSNILTTAWTRIVNTGSLTTGIEQIEVYNNSTSGTLALGQGSASAQGTILIVPPSTAKTVNIRIGANELLWLKAMDATVSAGDSAFTFIAK